MKKIILPIVLCCVYFFMANGQTVLLQAVPSSKTPTTFSLTRAANVIASTPKFTGFTDNTTSPCSFAPSRTVSETRMVYENAMAISGNRISFSIYPSSNNYKLLISSLGFKISSNNPNLRYNVHFRLATMPSAGSPYFDTALVPSTAITCNSSINTATTERVIKFPAWMVGTNIIDNINSMEVIVVFFGTSSAADVRVSSIKVNGCVLADNAVTDCLGKPVETGYHTGSAFPYSKYQLVYADEFDSTAYDRNEWVSRGFGGFGGLMADSNVNVSNGMLHLKYTWDTRPSSTVPGKNDTAFIGAGLQHTKNIKYGYYEFRTKLYKGLKGLHQSIWAVGSVSNSSQRNVEVNSSVNSYQNQLLEQDSYSSSLQPSIWTVKGRHYDYSNSRLKGANDDNFDSCAKYRTDGPSDVGFHAISHIKDIAVNSFFNCGVSIMPDSIRYYYNGKLRLSYPFAYPYDRDVMGMSMQLSALPTPFGYYTPGASDVPLPESGAEMTVDYMRYYAPKSCLGINFLSNFTFGDPWIMDTSYVFSPNGWVEPKTKDLLGNTVSYNADASYQDSTEFVPDAPNKYNITSNRWSLLHKLTTEPYKVATRQRLDLIPNGNYEFSAYVKGSNKPGDRVVLRVKTRTANNLADTIYEASANLGTNVADVNWRKVKISYVPVVDNYAVVEFLSEAATGSYTYFDSALFIGVGDTLFTVSKQGCLGGSIQLTTDKLIPDSTSYQWQVSTFSSNNYNPWTNMANGVTASGNTNGFGATYANVTKDSLIIGTIPAALQKARFRCLMTTPATATSVAYVRYGNTYQLDTINNALVVTPSVSTPVYLTGTLKLDVSATGGSGTISAYSWTGPANFSDTSKTTYLSKITTAQNGTYQATVTDNQGCYLTNSIAVTAQVAPANPMVVVAAAASTVTSYSSLSLTATVTGGSGNYSYLWRGPKGFSATTLNPVIPMLTTANSGNYTLIVTDLTNNFIESDTEWVNVSKRPQTLNFRNIPNLNTYNTTTTTIPLAATASSGLPVSFQSSNTHLLSFLNDTLSAVQMANPDYSFTLLNPVSTSKIRIYTTQSSHFHIRELRAFGVESADYLTDVLENVPDSLPNGLVNLAADATVSASGQYAIGTAYWPQNAVDGLMNSSWVSQPSTTSPAEKWLQLDFGSNKTIGNIQFVNGYQNSNGTWAGLMDNNLLKVQYWDGTTWQSVTDCKVNVTALQAGDDNNLPVSVVQQICINTTSKTVQRNVLPPMIVLPTIASVTNNSAVVGATVMDSSGVNLTAKGMVVDTFPNPTTTVSHPNTLSNTYTLSLANLKGNTQYYCKGYAINAAGTSYTSDTSFITLPNTPALSFINVTTIGYCVNFLQSQGGNQSHTTELQISSQANFQTVQSYFFTGVSGSRCISNLSPNTLYYVRVRSTNSVGNGAWATSSVTTLPLPTAILDGMAAPTSAFSTRMLRSAYNQKVLRVRRDVDSTFADVYFDSKQTISLNSPISFSGSTPIDSTLGAWLGISSAFVSVWYDQSGNNNHAYKNTVLIARTGTVTITNGSNTLSGSGTSFSTANTPVGGILTTATGRVIGRVATINSTTSITLATAANFSQSGVGYGLLRQPRLADRGILDTLENGSTSIRFFQGANSGTNLQHPSFLNDSGYANLTNMRHIHLFAVVKQENTFNFAGLFNTTGLNSGSSAPANRFQFQLLTNSTTRNSFFNGVAGPNTNNNIRATAFTMNGVMNARFKMTTTAGVATASIPIATSGNPSTANNFLSAGNFNGDSIQLFGHSAASANMFEGIATELVFYGSTAASPITENQATSLFANQAQTFGVLSITNPTVGNILPNEATLGATIFRSASATISSRGSVYDTVAQPRGNASAISGDYSGLFTQTRTGLMANTQYYFRGFITTGADTTFTSDSSFITLPLAPSVKTTTAITTNSAQAQFGFSGAMGRVPFTFSLQFASTNGFNTSDTFTIQNLSDSSYQMTNLLPNTIYYYRALIKNAVGNSTWSAIQSFTTLVALPTLNAPKVTAITANAATLGATVTQNGGQTLSSRGTVFSTTSLPTANSLAEGNTVIGTFAHVRGNLNSNMRYFFRGYAANSAGTAYTNDSSFITLPEQCSLINTSAITPISFTPRWNPSTGTADYTVTIQVSLASDFSNLVYNLSGIGDAKVSYLITALNSSTVYYYRIRFENQTGVGAWSAVQSITTASRPTSSLDNNGTPLFAYSVRLLRSSYTGPLARVRRDHTCDSVDVYADGNQRLSLSSPISANGGGVATGNTLADWVGNNSAYITIWYDQSGNGKHTTSATLSRTGTISVTTGNTAVSGTSTLFTTNTQLVVGNALYGSSGQLLGHVETINSATSLTLTGGAKNSVTNNTLFIQRLPRLVNKGVFDTLPSGIASLRIMDGANGGLYATGLITPTTSLQNLKFVNVFVTQRQLANTSNKVGLLNTASANSGSPSSKLQFNLEPSASNSFYRGVSAASTSTSPTFGNTLLASGRLKVSVYANSANAQVASSFQALSAPTSNFLGTNNANVFDNTSVRIFGNLGLNSNCFDGLASEIVLYGSATDSLTESFASNYLLDQTNYFGVVSVSKPTVSAISANSAVLGATVATFSGAIITARGTAWGTSPKPTANATAEGSTNMGAYTHTRAGLAANTLYYYRGYITNALGTIYSEDSVFTTLHNTPVIASASNVWTTGFNANWSAPSGGNAAFTYILQYSTTADFSSGNTVVSNINVTNTLITGLTPNTNYYYRVQCLNTSGASVWSATQAVTTLSNAPVFAVATNTCSDRATVNWTAPANPSGAAYTYSLQYATTNDFNSAVTTIANIGSGVLSQSITNLAPNTTYYFRIAVVNTGGTSAFGLSNVSTTANHNWTGATSTDWVNAGNWCGNLIPSTSMNVEIPSGLSNYPLIAGSSAVNNLLINTNSSLTVTGTLQIGGAITNNGILDLSSATLEWNGTSPQSIPSGSFVDNTVRDLTVNNSAGVTLLDTLKIVGTLTPTLGTLTTNDKLVLLSSTTGTARIAAGSGNYLNGGVSVQRFIPSKAARKYSFIAATTNQTIRNGWQNQIYITGAGTGGQTCGADTGTGGTTDRYNSNGFDKTQVNTPSMFTYNVTPSSNGSRWVTIANTINTNLEAGRGYRVNIRGDRNVGTCEDQLNSNAPAAPTAVTLQTIGTVSTGNVAVTLNNPSTHLYTLLGNPYPSQISFTSLLASSAADISNKMWTYSPYGNGNYTTYSNGLIANAATGYDNTNGDFIASGQAFFVEGKTTGSGTVTFQESHKASGTIPNTQYFGTTNQQLIRIGLKTSGDSSLDEAVIRFNGLGNKQYLADWDAISFGGAAQNLAIQKGSNRLAIATLPSSNTTDSILLTVKSSENGSFKLNFSDLDGLDSIKTFWLSDAYLNQNQNIRNIRSYAFNITADSLSKGDSRFLLLAKPAGTTLLVRFIALNAKASDRKEAVVNWTVVGAKDVDTYVVERSTNGVSFAPIASVKATSATQYSIKYAQLPESTEAVYYRILTTEKDGQKVYSNIVQLTTNHSPLITIIPNPAKGTFMVQLPTVATNQRYSVTVYNVEGKAVLTEQSLTPTEANNLRLTTQGLTSGVYQLKVQGEDGAAWTARLQVGD